MGPGRDEDPDELTGANAPEGGERGGEGGGEDPRGPARAGPHGGGEEPGYMDRPEEESDPYPLEDEDEEDEFDGEREETGESVTIEIAGLSLYTHHGVGEAEREVGQRLVLDLRLDLGEADATVTDAIEDTVDYGEVCQLVALIAQQRSHATLERLCGTIADRLLGDYELEGVWVKATKPEPPIALHVDEVSVEVWREAEE
jgi:dihydroneopterin aldolase